MDLPLDAALADFLDHQRARRRSDRTRELYRQTIVRLGKWLAAEGKPTTVGSVTKREINAFLIHLQSEVGPGTVALHFRNLRAFFNWLAAEEEIDASPLARMLAPVVPDVPPPILGAEELEALFAACKGRGVDERRDLAMLMVFADTGCRLGEVHGLEVDAFNREYRTLSVTGKGNKTRTVAIGDRTLDALNKYLRSRRAHSHTKAAAMWLGRTGPLTSSGVSQIVKKRGLAAGIEGLHPHLFRHTFAHAWLSAGGQEGDLMMLAGWSSPEMVRRYGRVAAADRARDAHRSLSPVDRLK
ncbi:MAG: tyrosine-type recombinase/integrase [Acidimicrobiales bacterium]